MKVYVLSHGVDQDVFGVYRTPERANDAAWSNELEYITIEEYEVKQ